jgi:hypothetical protein
VSEDVEPDVITAIGIDPDDEESPLGLRRFGRQLLALEAAFAKAREHHASVDAEGPLAHAVYRAGARTQLFMLEGLARIHLGMDGDAELFGAVRHDTKVLEDGLGEVDFWWVVRDVALKTSAPTPLVEWLHERHFITSGRVEGWLEARRWIAHRHMPLRAGLMLRGARMAKSMIAADWPSPKREQRRLARYLAKRLRKVHEEGVALDLTKLESGVHELRRKLRWFSIYAAALEGGVMLDTTAAAPEGWERYLAPEVVDSPFNRLPEPKSGQRPVLIPAPLYYALSWTIAKLGELKDGAQLDEALRNAAENAGVEVDVPAMLGERGRPVAEACAEGAIVAHEVLERDQLLLRMAEAIEAQI